MTMSVSAITSVSMPYASTASASAVSVSTALEAIANSRAKNVVIADTADNIARNIDALQSVRGKIASISVSDDKSLSISAKQLQASSGVLGKIGSYTVDVTDASAAQVKSLATNAKVSAIAVLDTVANLGDAIDALQANVAKISEIRQRGPANAIEITAAQLGSAADVIGKIKDSYSLNVSKVSIAALPGIAENDHVRGIGVVDTGANIASNLDLLQSHGVKLLGAEVSDKQALSVSAAQVQSDALVLGKIYGGYQLNVRGAALADLAELSRNNKVKTIEVEDTAENVARNLDQLQRLGKSLTAITITDPDSALQMSAKDYDAFAKVLKKIATDGVHFALSNASVADAADLADDTAVTSFAVTDTAGRLADGMNVLDGLGSRLSGIKLKGNSTQLAVSAAELTDYASTIAKIGNNYALSVSAVAAADAKALAERTDVSNLSIADSSANIATAWDDLTSTPVLAKIRQVAQTGTAEALALSAAQIGKGNALLAKISGQVQMSASAVGAAAAIALAKDSRITDMAVVDSSANLSKYFDALDGLGSKLKSLSSGDDTDPLSLTASQLRTKSATLDKISGDYSIAVRLAFASDAATIAAKDHVSSVSVADTASNLSANLGALKELGDTLAKIDVFGSSSIRISAGELDGMADTLAKIGTAYSLAVTNAAAADAKSIAARDRVVGVTVSDSSANIAASLADLNAIGTELESVTQSSVAPMEIDIATLLANGKVLSKISNDYQLKLTGVSVKQADYAATLRNVTSMDIVDSSGAIAANFNKLLSLNPLIGAIEQTGTPAALSLTRAQRTAGSALLQKIDEGDYALSISDARAADVATLSADEHVSAILVTDTAVNLSQQLAALKSAMAVGDSEPVDKLAKITLAGNDKLQMTGTDLARYDGVLYKIASPYLIDVRETAAADAATVAARDDVATLSVTDGSAAIAGKLDALQGIGKKLKSITVSGDSTTLSLTASQLAADASALAKISNRYSLSVNNVSAESATRVAANANVSTMAIVDSSGNIASRIDSLQKVVGKIGSITQSGTAAALQITAAQRTANAAVLAKLDDYTLAIRQAPASDAAKLADDDLVASFSVTDSIANIGSHFDALAAAGDKLTGIVQSGSAAPLSLTLKQYTDNTATLAKIINSYDVALSGVKASEAAAAADHEDVATVEVSDSAGAIATDMAALNAIGIKLKSLTVSGNDKTLELSASQYRASRRTLEKIAGDYAVSVSAASAADASAIAANPVVKKVDVSDTSARVARNFDTLAGLGTELGTITLDSVDDAIAITVGQYSENATLLGKLSGEYKLALSGASAEKATALAGQDHVSTVSVSDSGANLMAHLPALKALDAKLATITLTDNLTPLSMSGAQWTDAASTFDKINNGFRASLSGVAAADAASVGADKRVSSLSVDDSGEAVGGKLAELQALGNKLAGISLAGGSTVALTAAQLKSSAAVIAKITTGYSLQVSEVTAARAAAIGGRDDVDSFALADSAANLSTYWNTLLPLAAGISGITQSDSDAIALSAAQFAQSASLLAKLGDDYQLAISKASAEAAAGIADDSHVKTVSVSDGASQLSAHLEGLVGIIDKLETISVSDAGKLSLSATLLQSNADLMAKIDTNYTLSVSGAGAADATTLAANSRVVEIAVEDSSDNIAAELDKLQALGDKLVSIDQTGTPSTMSVSASQLVSDADALNKIVDRYTLAVTNAGASYAMQLADLPTVATITVRDSAANIADQLDELQSLGEQLTGISISDAAASLQVSGEQYAANQSVLQKLSDLKLSVTGATASQLTALAADTRVTAIGVQDSADQIGSEFNALVALGDTLASIGLAGDGSRITLSAAQYASGAATLAKIAGSYTLSLTGMGAEDAAALASDQAVATLTVSDTAANLVAQLSGLAELGSRLLSMSQSDTGDLTVTSAAYSSGQALWPKFSGNLSLAVTGVKAEDVALIAQQAYVASVSVSDSSVNVADNWDALSAAANKLQGVALSDAGTALKISAAQLQTGAALIGKLPDGYALSVSGAGADDAQAIAANDHVSALAVADTADNIVNALAMLSTLDKLASFTVTDGSTLELTAAQQESYATLLAKLDASITVSLPA